MPIPAVNWQPVMAALYKLYFILAFSPLLVIFAALLDKYEKAGEVDVPIAIRRLKSVRHWQKLP